MSLSDFEQTIRNLPIHGQIVSMSFGETRANEHFACIINKILWYKCRLYLEVDRGIEASGIHLLAVTEHTCNAKAKQKCEEWVKCLTANSNSACAFGK